MNDEHATERYNGWANRETWAFNLHWSNDEGLYSETLEEARGYLVETYGPDWRDLPADELRGASWGVGEHVRDYWRDLIDTWESDTGERLPAVLTMLRDEVGSWWRVDEADTGVAVCESLQQ